jgi:hypothetical protein
VLTEPDRSCLREDSHEIRAALARVLRSAPFRSAPRLAAFIRFVVERTLAGDGEHIKAYTIATGAFGRKADFNPQTDPIVRVEAGRLRQALARYYAGEGADEPIEIALPLGRYVPDFHRRIDRAAPRVANGSRLTRWETYRRRETALHDVFDQIIAIRCRQLSEMAAEIEDTRALLDHTRALLQSLPDPALACRPPARLLPTAPSSRDAKAADVRKTRQIQQAQGAPAARAGRSRPG